MSGTPVYGSFNSVISFDKRTTYSHSKKSIFGTDYYYLIASENKDSILFVRSDKYFGNNFKSGGYSGSNFKKNDENVIVEGVVREFGGRFSTQRLKAEMPYVACDPPVRIDTEHYICTNSDFYCAMCFILCGFALLTFIFSTVKIIIYKEGFVTKSTASVFLSLFTYLCIAGEMFFFGFVLSRAW